MLSLLNNLNFSYMRKNVYRGLEKKVRMKAKYKMTYTDVLRIIILGICDAGWYLFSFLIPCTSMSKFLAVWEWFFSEKHWETQDIKMPKECLKRQWGTWHSVDEKQVTFLEQSDLFCQETQNLSCTTKLKRRWNAGCTQWEGSTRQTMSFYLNELTRQGLVWRAMNTSWWNA